MANYELIMDESMLDEFIAWLPELEDNEQYYLTLLARTKYLKVKGLPTDKAQLKRVTATKDRIIQKIRQLEIAEGGYTWKNVEIPSECLALYITPNPRDMHKASLNLLKTMASKLAQSETLRNPKSMAMNAIQVSSSRQIYMDVDVDFVSGVPRDECEKAFHEARFNEWKNDRYTTLIRTRGGYHMLVHITEIPEEDKSVWYNRIRNTESPFFDIMMNGTNNLIPVVGCRQSNYVPQLIKPDEWDEDAPDFYQKLDKVLEGVRAEIERKHG